MAVSSYNSFILSITLTLIVFAGMQLYKVPLASSEWGTILGGFLGEWLRGAFACVFHCCALYFRFFFLPFNFPLFFPPFSSFPFRIPAFRVFADGHQQLGDDHVWTRLPGQDFPRGKPQFPMGANAVVSLWFRTTKNQDKSSGLFARLLICLFIR